jgi:hypothetical protein
MDPAAWPERYRWVVRAFYGDGFTGFSRRELVRNLGREFDDERPHFWLAANERLVAYALGLDGWERMLPMIDDELAVL